MESPSLLEILQLETSQDNARCAFYDRHSYTDTFQPFSVRVMITFSEFVIALFGNTFKKCGQKNVCAARTQVIGQIKSNQLGQVLAQLYKGLKQELGKTLEEVNIALFKSQIQLIAEQLLMNGKVSDDLITYLEGEEFTKVC